MSTKALNRNNILFHVSISVNKSNTLEEHENYTLSSDIDHLQ